MLDLKIRKCSVILIECRVVWIGVRFFKVNEEVCIEKKEKKKKYCLFFYEFGFGNVDELENILYYFKKEIVEYYFWKRGRSW